MVKTGVSDWSLQNSRELQGLCFAVLQSLEQCQRPRVRDPKWGTEFEMGLRGLSERLRAFVNQSANQMGPLLSDRFRRLERGFEAYREALSSATPSVEELRARYRELCAEYEATLTELRKQGVRSWVGRGHLKPVNYWRNLFHAVNATVAAVLYQWVLTREQALWALGGVAVCAVALEVSRKSFPRLNDFLVDRVFGLVSRPKERHAVNSATWYLFALIVGCALFPKEAMLVALLILGYSDPLASIVGKRFGSIKVRGQKSLQGTLAFFVSAGLIGFFYAMAAEIQLSNLSWLAWTLGVPLSATAAELYGDRVDDNFGILIAAGLAATLALAVI